MKKRKIQTSGTLSDIRSFFKLFPGKNKAASPIAYGEATIIGTPANDAATPSLTPSRAPGHCGVPTGSNLAASPPSPKKGSTASSQETIEVDPLESTALRKRPALLQRRPVGESSLDSPEKEVTVLGSTSLAAAAAAATTIATQASIYEREDDKENGRGAMAAVGTSASMISASRAMSGLYLVGPLPALRDTGNKLRCATQSQNRFPLPVGKSVLGRNSIRDTFPGNSSKIRIGIDAMEEGVSRSQATLQVHASCTYIVVTNNPNAMNPIRVRRRTASQGSSAVDPIKPTVQRVKQVAAASPASQKNPKPPGVQVLKRGQTAKVYPGDTLQLDGFRNPDRSKYSYILHPLPADDAKPAGVGASASAGAAIAPPEVDGTRASNQEGIADKGDEGRGAVGKCRDSMVAGKSDLCKDGASRAPIVVTTVSSRGYAMSLSSLTLPTGETAKKPRIISVGEKGQTMTPSGAPATRANPSPSATGTLVVAPFPTPPTLVGATGDEDPSSTILSKRARPENDDGGSSLPGSSKSSRHSSPGTSVTCRSASSLEGGGSGPSNTTGAIEDPPGKGGQEVIGGYRSSGATLATSSEGFAAADAGRLTVASETVAQRGIVPDLSAADRNSEITLSASGPTVALEPTTASTRESTVLVCDGGAAAAGSGAPQTPFTPGKHGSGAVAADGDGRGEGTGGEATGGALWGVGDVVLLSPRVGKGENKLGGVAHVKRVFEDGTYLVKLVLPGAAPTRVSAGLLSRFDPPPGGLATRGRRSSSASKEHLPPKRGDRARVLFDEYDWYMGTVVRVHNDGEVTVRYDGGSEEKVALIPGEAEMCSDNDLAPSVRAQLMATLSRSRGGSKRGSRSSKGHGAGDKGWRTLDPWGALVLSGENVKLLTKARTTALLDTAPEKLIGLTYRKRVNSFGWVDAVVREVVYRGAGDKSRGADPGWPESVLIDTDKGGNEESDDDFVRQRTSVSRRKIRAFLGELQAWDEHWKRTVSCREASGERGSEPRKRSPSGKAAIAKGASARSPSGGKKTPRKSTVTRSPSLTTRGVTRLKNTVVPARKGKSPKGRRSRVRPVIRVAASGSVTSRKASKGETPAAVGITPSPLRQADATVEEVGINVTDAEDTTVNKKAIAKQAREVAKKQVALKRKSAAERGRTICPFCSSEFYRTESREAVDAHLAACGRKAAEAEVTSSAGSAARPGSTAGGGDAVTMPAQTKLVAVRRVGTVMTMSLSSALSIYVKGRDLGSLVAAVEELAARGVRPTSALCDRVMQEMLESRCYFRTEYLRRTMKNSLAAHPTCWQPLNWGVFEETLQFLAKERNLLALNAHTAAIGVSLDCLEASRRWRQMTAGRVVALPPLFLGADGDRGGRAVVKRCARWAAMAWARRGEPALAGDEAQANVCMVMSRAVGESLEAFSLAGEGRAAVLEGCQLAAVEMESHGEVGADAGGSEMAARCRAGLLRPLSGRPFFSTLAEVLLHNMPTEEGGIEVELLKAMLSRHVGHVSAASGGRRGRASATSGCALLFADMAT